MRPSRGFLQCSLLLSLTATVVLCASFSGPTLAKKKECKVRQIPPSGFQVEVPYPGSARVRLVDVNDRRLMENPRYVGTTHSGLFNVKKTLCAHEDVAVLVKEAFTDGLRSWNLLAEEGRHVSANVTLDLYRFWYREETFMTSEYSLAEVVVMATFDPAGAQTAAAAIWDTNELLIRAFEVRKVFDGTKQAPTVIRAAIQQAVDRFLASETVASLVEHEHRELLARDFSPSRGHLKWSRKYAKITREGATLSGGTDLDLSDFDNLVISRLEITDEVFLRKDDIVVERSRDVAYQEMFTVLAGRLYRKFERIAGTSDEVAGRTVVLRAKFDKFNPFSAGEATGAALAFGLGGAAAAGKGRLRGSVDLIDAATEETLGTLTVEAKGHLAMQEVCVAVADPLELYTGDHPRPRLEVSWTPDEIREE